MEKIEDFTTDVINRLMKQIDFFNGFQIIFLCYYYLIE